MSCSVDNDQGRPWQPYTELVATLSPIPDSGQARGGTAKAHPFPVEIVEPGGLAPAKGSVGLVMVASEEKIRFWTWT